MSRYPRAKLYLFALISVALASTSGSVTAGADNTVYLAIHSSGTTTAEIAEGSLQSVGFSAASQSDPGVLTLKVSDLRGSSAGWCISIVSSDFAYDGFSPIGRGVKAEAFQIHAADPPQLIAGQPLVAGGPNFAPLLGASLDTPRLVLWAAPGSGSGEYEQAIRVIWNVPANAQSGPYSAILTVTISSAP